ncbi:SPOR domain-containing protein [Paracoccus alkenifer]|uniref:Sporulation related domain-containing protein n=1 Tax=Paracoccus alkenifer TaxID=65735 RepID=A0A1H6LEE2_9RHOB|nr:SPOR domain-containing protein [Paracoccus alkenifer]SEH86842.1 Sporulation related domain-containing protein [Paracoccus alkenifer]
MWLRVVALLFIMVFALGLPAQAGETGPRRADGPPADPRDSHRPAEEPPSDFSGLQYIDSAGCVFLRTEAGWRARLARDGAPICGLPPTLALRPGRETSPEPEPRAVQIERILTETIITNMQAGELADPAPAKLAGAPRAFGPQTPDKGESSALGSADPDPLPDPLNVGRMLAHAPALRRQLVGAGRAEALCELVGGGDPLGLCGKAEGGLTPDLPLLSAHAPARAPIASADPAPTGTAPPDIAADLPGSVQEPRLKAATQPVAPPAAVRTTETSRPKAAVPSPAAAQPGAPGSSPETGGAGPLLIPAGARYLEVGVFTDPDQAQATAASLVAMGLPVVRTKPRDDAGLAIMVGPLEGREAIVRMADRLRKAGFTRLVARR